MKDNLKITIATVTYNAAATLAETIQSVTGQSYQNIEYILVDGNSTDNTVSIAKSFAEYYSFITIKSEPDNGIYEAMNKAQQMATGDFLIFIGSDDVLYDARVIEHFTHCVTDNTFIYYGDVFGKNAGERWYGPFTLEKLILQNLPHQAIFYPKSVYKFYSYNLKYNTFSDWDYNMNLWSQGVQFIRIDLIVSIYAENGRSVTNPDKLFLKDRPHLIRTYFGSKHLWLLKMQRLKQRMLGKIDLRKVKGLVFPKLK